VLCRAIASLRAPAYRGRRRGNPRGSPL